MQCLQNQRSELITEFFFSLVGTYKVYPLNNHSLNYICLCGFLQLIYFTMQKNSDKYNSD